MDSIQANTKSFESDTGFIDAQKIFVDRETQSQIFRQKLGLVPNKGNQLIYYAGAGGIGKTALIRELEKYVNGTSSVSLKFKSVSYDFTFGTEMLTVLNALKKSLIDKYQIEFPFFDIGCLSYYKKCGDESGKNQIEKILKESTFFCKCKQKINTAIGQSYNARNVNKILDGDIEALEYVAESSTFFRILKSLVVVADNHITGIQNIRNENNPEYRNVIDELEKRQGNFFPEATKEYLPELFAKDITVWLEENDIYLTIFFDTYEQLTDDEKNLKRHQKLIYKGIDVPVDWWIAELLLKSKRVLWVIAGRGEIEKIGENFAINKDKSLEKDNQLYRLKALENDFVDKFLNAVGIKESALCNGIKELTGGYPIYLNVCADTYRKIVANNEVPFLENFGEKRESVVSRLLDYMDEKSRLTVYQLGILGIWTDNLAEKLLVKLNNYNPYTYNRLKKLSFVTADKNLFVFDRSIRKILIDYAGETVGFTELIPQTCAAIKEIFNEIFSDKNEKNLELYFKIWCNVILGTAKNSNELMEQYEKNFALLKIDLSNAVLENVINKFQVAVKKFDNTEKTIPFAYFEHLTAQTKFLEGNDSTLRELSKIAYKEIAAKKNISNLKKYLTAGQYAMALFYAVETDKNTDEFKSFSNNFKTAIEKMTTAKKEIVLEHFNFILKNLLQVYRNNNETLKVIDSTMKFIGENAECLGECLNKFVANLKLYQLTAYSHLGQLEKFKQLAENDCFPAVKKVIEQGENPELYLIYANRIVVYLQEIFDYRASLELGNKIKILIENLQDKNFYDYKDQYCRLCGSLALTCYSTLNNSNENLELARNLTDLAANGFIKTEDKKRQYQLRAQIEAEADNFETACKMLDGGISITIENPTADQFKKFRAFEWYHFAKFSERLLNSNDEKYFDIAARAIETAKEEFLNYRNKIGDKIKHPDYITFSKMGACFNILGDNEHSIELHETALLGVDSDNGDDAAVFQLVMLANYLLTLEKNKNFEKFKEVAYKIKNLLDAYFKRVNVDSMKVPFIGWQDSLNEFEKNSADKIAILEKMSRAILL